MLSQQISAYLKLTVWEEMLFEEFQDGHHGSHWNNFINSDSLFHSDASHQVLAQSDLVFGRRYHLKTFVMATIEGILDIEMKRF